jgi:hypothetical protein
MAEFIDPYGAAEYFCNDMVLERVAPGLVKARMLSRENGEAILRCTLLLPETVLGQNVERACEFMDSTPRRMMAN